MDKIIGLCVSFFLKLGGGTMEFIGENLRRAKGFRFFIFYCFNGFIFYYVVSIGIMSV